MPRRPEALPTGALPLLQWLFLSNNQIGDIGLQALAKAITPDKDGKGAMAQLNTLDLNDNMIGDFGLTALADALANGALAWGAKVSLCGNRVANTGKQAALDSTRDRGRKLVFGWRDDWLDDSWREPEVFIFKGSRMQGDLHSITRWVSSSRALSA